MKTSLAEQLLARKTEIATARDELESVFSTPKLDTSVKDNSEHKQRYDAAIRKCDTAYTSLAGTMRSIKAAIEPKINMMFRHLPMQKKGSILVFIGNFHERLDLIPYTQNGPGTTGEAACKKEEWSSRFSGATSSASCVILLVEFERPEKGAQLFCALGPSTCGSVRWRKMGTAILQLVPSGGCLLNYICIYQCVGCPLAGAAASSSPSPLVSFLMRESGMGEPSLASAILRFIYGDGVAMFGARWC